MTKIILVLAITAAIVAGSIATGTLAFAGGDDDDDLSQLACEAGKVMTGLLFDDDDITDILCATDNVNDADSDPTNEIQTLSISGQDLTISGGNTVTLPSDSAPQAFHLKGTQTSTNGALLQPVNGLSKTFTLSEATVVFVSSDVEVSYSNPSGQFARAAIVIDNTRVSTGPFLDDDATALMFFPAHVSWTGQLSAGTHTISTHMRADSGGTACSLTNLGCNMNILVLGQ